MKTRGRPSVVSSVLNLISSNVVCIISFIRSSRFVFGLFAFGFDFREFPFTKVVAGGTTLKYCLLVEVTLVPTALRCIPSLFQNLFTGLHVALLIPCEP